MNIVITRPKWDVQVSFAANNVLASSDINRDRSEYLREMGALGSARDGKSAPT